MSVNPFNRLWYEKKLFITSLAVLYETYEVRESTLTYISSFYFKYSNGNPINYVSPFSTVHLFHKNVLSYVKTFHLFLFRLCLIGINSNRK